MGEAPGSLFVNDDGELVLATLQCGNVVLLIQPPRGFGENPVAIYLDPDLAVTRHYLAAYGWLEHGFRADAVVHLGKHGSLEWLPGKNAALSPACGPDAAQGSLPLIYPFLINDPGEGAQAKRRAHATIVDHLVPPMARAESYGDIARLEGLLEEYDKISTMDPAKRPAIRGEIWQLMHAAELHRDLGLEERPEDEESDDFLLHADGWLAVRDRGRPDPRRPVRARRRTRGRGAGQPGAVDPARRPGLGRRRQRRARTARRARSYRGRTPVEVDLDTSAFPAGPRQLSRRTRHADRGRRCVHCTRVRYHARYK